MPLTFHSLSHGRVAFGFFHIETDMLLLERLFFWAEDLCALWRGLAASPPDADFRHELAGYRIASPMALGDLHGAIAGRDLGGFLGTLYARWPFPQARSGLVQKTQGVASRRAVAELLAGLGQERAIVVTARPGPGLFSLDDYVFDGPGLAALVDYVWRGGMPGWQEGRRPGYLLATAQALVASPSPWLQSLDWDPDRVGFPY